MNFNFLILIILFAFSCSSLQSQNSIRVTDHPYNANPAMDDTWTDGAKIQKAIDDCRGQHCEIIIPPGVYEIEAPLKLKSNMHLNISPTAILKTRHRGANCDVESGILNISSCENVTISGGEFIGSFPYKWIGDKWADNGEQVSRSRYGGVRHYCDKNYGILIKGSHQITIKNGVFHQFRGDAIILHGQSESLRVKGSNTVLITQNTFYNMIDNSISIGWQNKDVIISNNTIRDQDGDGIVVKANNVIIEGNIISNLNINQLGGPNAAGVAITPYMDFNKSNNVNRFNIEPWNTADFIIVSGNIIRNVHGMGIANDNSQFVLVNGNIINNITDFNGVKFGCIENAESLISDNIIVDTEKRASIRSDSRKVIITDNWLTNKPGCGNEKEGPISGRCGPPIEHEIVENNGINMKRK